jgi:imidazolonepropionase-like amidohydrolase
MKYAIPPDSVKNWIATRDKIQQIPQADRAKLLGLRRRFVKALHDAGVPFALGSDAPQFWNVPGFSAHRELRALVDAGLTPYQALRTGTKNVSTYFGTESTTGTVGAGKRADLVLLDANPLENIDNSTRIAGVMVNGRWLAKADIDKRLAEGS